MFYLEPIKISVCIYSQLSLNKVAPANSVKTQNKSCSVVTQLMSFNFFSGQLDRRMCYDELLQ